MLQAGTVPGLLDTFRRANETLEKVQKVRVDASVQRVQRHSLLCIQKSFFISFEFVSWKAGMW